LRHGKVFAETDQFEGGGPACAELNETDPHLLLGCVNAVLCGGQPSPTVREFAECRPHLLLERPREFNGTLLRPDDLCLEPVMFTKAAPEADRKIHLDPDTPARVIALEYLLQRVSKCPPRS